MLDEGFRSAADAVRASDLEDDPVIGKLVDGFVTIKHADGGNDKLALNWRSFCNMAMPIVEHQLAKVAINGMCLHRSIKVNLGTLMLDNSVKQLDAYSYHKMDKDNNKDMIQCEV